MRAALLALLVSAAAALPVAAHTRLERSTPADGDTLRAQPRELSLEFSQAVAPQYTRLLLRGPDGAAIPTPPLEVDAGRRTFRTAAPQLRAGRYAVEWRTAAADGHVITGTFEFVFAPDAADAEVAAAASDPGAADALRAHHVETGLLPAYLRPGGAPGVVARALLFAALLGVIGLAVFQTLVLPRSGLAVEARQALQGALRRFGLVAAALLLLVLPLRLWLQSGALHGPGRAFETDLLGAMLLQLDWGHAWLVQLAAAVLALGGVVTGLTPLVAVAAAALAFTPALQGHAAAVERASPLAVVLDGTHVLAAGAWVGALAVLVIAAIPTLRRGAAAACPGQVRQLVHRFTPLALTAAALLAASGVGSALLHVPAPADLVATDYGRTLLVKLFLVALVLGTGWYNWRRAGPDLGSATGTAALHRAATLELCFAGAALAATAVLVALPTP